MNDFLLMNDLHLGLERNLGATVQSMHDYEDFQFRTLQALLERHSHPDSTLIILGDLFAKAEISNRLLLKTLNLLMFWTAPVLLAMGNHDQPKDRSQLSSLELLSELLPNCTLIKDTPYTPEGATFTILPHTSNQDLFDAAVLKAAETSAVLLAHCNYDNFFATQQDHSLNLTPEQAGLFEQVIIGHEHVKRRVGNVVALGSPWPCNIAEADGHDHYYHVWDRVSGNLPTAIKVWSHSGSYQEQDWKELDPTKEAEFIRITGTAEPGEANLVVQEAAKLRAKSSAVMISNSVKIGLVEVEELDIATKSLEDFRPLNELLALLSEKHQKALEAFHYNA